MHQANSADLFRDERNALLPWPRLSIFLIPLPQVHTISPWGMHNKGEAADAPNVRTVACTQGRWPTRHPAQRNLGNSFPP